MSGMRFTPKGYGGHRRNPDEVKRDGWKEQGLLAVAIDDDRLRQNVNGYRLDVLEPLQELHLTLAETEGISADLTWRGLFPAALEKPHDMLTERRVTLQACRFCAARLQE